MLSFRLQISLHSKILKHTLIQFQDYLFLHSITIFITSKYVHLFHLVSTLNFLLSHCIYLELFKIKKPSFSKRQPHFFKIFLKKNYFKLNIYYEILHFF